MREYELNLYVDKITWMAVKKYINWACEVEGATAKDFIFFCMDNDLNYKEIAMLGSMALKYTYEYEV